MRVVLCDYDEVLRRVVAQVVTKLGHQVVGSTGNAIDAIELAHGCEADLLILDTALGTSSTHAILHDLLGRENWTDVVVFTPFAGTDGPALLRAGANEVIEKPDFAELEQAIVRIGRQREKLAESLAAEAEAGVPWPRRPRRMRPDADTRPPMLSPAALSPSGVEPRMVFREALEASVPGDQILVVAVQALEEVTSSWGDLLAMDHRLAVARTARDCLREGDRMTVDEVANVIMLLVGGQAEGAERAFARIETVWESKGAAGTLRGGWATREEGESPTVTVARAHGALIAAQLYGPDRLVKG